MCCFVHLWNRCDVPVVMCFWGEGYIRCNWLCVKLVDVSVYRKRLYGVLWMVTCSTVSILLSVILLFVLTHTERYVLFVLTHTGRHVLFVLTHTGRHVLFVLTHTERIFSLSLHTLGGMFSLSLHTLSVSSLCPYTHWAVCSLSKACPVG